MKNLLITILALFCLHFTALCNDSAVYYFQKGVEEKTAKRFLVASKNFEIALKFDPTYKEAYLESGYTNLEMRKMAAALQDFKKVNELDPSNELAIKELSSLYFAFKQYQKAVEFANRCSTCDDKDKIIGISYYNDENYGLAEKKLAPYVQKNPADADAAFALARTYLELENEKKAIDFYELAVKAKPTNASWHSELGLIYYNINQFKKAIESFTNAVKNGITQTNDFKENYAFAYIYANDVANAEPILQDLIIRKAGNKELLRDIAEAYYTAKLYDNSLTYCQRLMEMDAKDGKALYQAGLCFQKKGQTDRGQKMCDAAIEMDPSLGKMRTQKSLPVGL
jgi:tetratricopeptide (TPR) repeat protein